MNVGDPTQGGQDRIWNHYQNESPELFAGSQARVRYLLSRIERDASVLNIGCGTGLLERAALDAGLDIHSLDPSEQSIARLRSGLRLGDRAQVGYIQQIPFAEARFDVVIVTEVLEHLTTPIADAGLAEIRRVLKPRGRVLGTVPSRENLRDQSVVCPSCAKEFHRWGHQQSFDPAAIQALLSGHFRAVAVIERPFISWSTLTWRGKVASAAKLLLWRLGSHGSNENLFFEAVALDP